MPSRSVTVSLRNGVNSGSLPDGRRMVAAKTYSISWEDYQKISPGARQTVIQVNSFDNTIKTQKNIDLTTNTASIPNNLKLGQVEEGVGGGDAVMFVKAGATLAAGDVLVWVNKDPAGRTVTNVHTAGNVFAGVALGAITNGNYGWIQIDGEASGKVPDTTPVGSSLAADPTTNSTFRVATGSDKVVATNIDVGTTGGVAVKVALREAGRNTYRRRARSKIF